MVYILMGNGYEESEAIVPADLLRRAGVEVRFAALEGEVVASSRNIRLVADCSVADIDMEQLEMVVVPGGMGGTQAIRNDPAACDVLRKAAAKGTYVAAICAGPTVLASLGLLEGKRATCHPGMEDQLTGAIPVAAPVVADGQFITSQSAGTAFDFGYKLVEALAGPEAVAKVQEGVHYRA